MFDTIARYFTRKERAREKLERDREEWRIAYIMLMGMEYHQELGVYTLPGTTITHEPVGMCYRITQPTAHGKYKSCMIPPLLDAREQQAYYQMLREHGIMVYRIEDIELPCHLL